MSTKTKYGRQPIYGVLRRERWSFAALSRELGISHRSLYLAAYGQSRPSEEIRRLVPPFLDIPLESLFTEESLAKPANHGAGGWGVTRHKKNGR